LGRLNAHGYLNDRRRVFKARRRRNRNLKPEHRLQPRVIADQTVRQRSFVQRLQIHDLRSEV